MDHLTPYAIAHLRLTDIDKRFEAVMARHMKQSPLRWRDRMSWRASLARSTARHESLMFPHDIKAFDFYVHKRP